MAASGDAIGASIPRQKAKAEAAGLQMSLRGRALCGRDSGIARDAKGERGARALAAAKDACQRHVHEVHVCVCFAPASLRCAILHVIGKVYMAKVSRRVFALLPAISGNITYRSTPDYAVPKCDQPL